MTGENAVMSIFSSRARMVSPADALPSRASSPFAVPATHEVLGTPLHGPWADGTQVLYLAAGCFWGVEEIAWQLPGVVSSAVGYQGGHSAYPTYEEVCTGRTGQTESVLVAYDPARLPTLELLRMFWENHDPTQGYRQGNDIGTQYRSAIFWTTDEQRDLAEQTKGAYAEVLAARGYDPITTEILPASDHPIYYAEAYHQQYLHKVPHGYRCHANTGVPLPI